MVEHALLPPGSSQQHERRDRCEWNSHAAFRIFLTALAANSPPPLRLLLQWSYLYGPPFTSFGKIQQCELPHTCLWAPRDILAMTVRCKARPPFERSESQFPTTDA